MIGKFPLRRVLYAIIGIAVIVQAILIETYLAIIPGLYFALMGIIGFGCAGNSCSTPFNPGKTTYKVEKDDKI